MRLRHIKPDQVPCTYCGAKPGEKCTVTLLPGSKPLSINWSHRTREELAAG